jgi:hypothetical protein
VILWKVPQWQVGQVKDLTPKERLVLGGAYFTWRNIKLAQESQSISQKALMVSQQGQITDRFTKAIEQLRAVDASGKKKAGGPFRRNLLAGAHCE